MIIFLKCPKIILSNTKATFNGTTVTSISKAAQNNWNPPSKVNIGSDRAIFLKKYFLNFSQISGKLFLNKWLYFTLLTSISKHFSDTYFVGIILETNPASPLVRIVKHKITYYLVWLILVWMTDIYMYINKLCGVQVSAICSQDTSASINLQKPTMKI